MKINFDRMLISWCSIKEIEVYLLCEILTSNDTLQGQKTVASLLKCCEGNLPVDVLPILATCAVLRWFHSFIHTTFFLQESCDQYALSKSPLNFVLKYFVFSVAVPVR